MNRFTKLSMAILGFAMIITGLIDVIYLATTQYITTKIFFSVYSGEISLIAIFIGLTMVIAGLEGQVKIVVVSKA